VTVQVRDGREHNVTLDGHGFELVDFDLEFDPGEKEGGEGWTSPAPRLPPIDYYDPESVVARYYPACERLVRDRLEKRPKGGRGPGAASTGVFVRAFDHNVRHASGASSPSSIRWREEEEGDDERMGGSKVLGPGGIVHNDYTANSAVRRLEQLSAPFGSGIDGDRYYRHHQNDVKLSALKAMARDEGSLPIIPGRLASGAILGKRRFAIVNVWRSLDARHPVRSFPLALLDAASVSPTDLKVLRIHYVDRVGENYVATAANRDHHRWYYFPAMKASEALLIKQWDSQGSLCRPGLPSDRSAVATPRPSPSSFADAPGPSSPPSLADFCSTFALHTAFAVPSGLSSPPPPPRRSIEVRCVCVWEEEEDGSVEE
jgi:hypothetical protein